MGQTWRDLLFAHWPLSADALANFVPAPLELDAYDGSAWLGITPFVLTALRPVAAPPPPLLATFPEINVRTYVTYAGKPGILFLSLDAASRLAVIAARRFYRLPYFHARISARGADGAVDYASKRIDERGHDARFRGRYAPTGREAEAPPGSLEAFLTERYCLYTLDEDARLLRAEIHHRPWQLRPADAEIAVNVMPPPGVELPGRAPLVHFSARQDVLIWMVEHA
jgi:uncharacterized protein